MASLIPEEIAVAPVVPEIQRYAVEAITVPDGLCMEFGVASGQSLTKIRKWLLAHIPLYGFDSFKGLPEDWLCWKKGSFRTQYRPTLQNTELVEGWYRDTVPMFAAQHPQPVSFMHIDCDLYSSTKTILDTFSGQVVPGTVILFDELFGYHGYEQHEWRALMEWGRSFECIARWDAWRAVIRIT